MIQPWEVQSLNSSLSQEELGMGNFCLFWVWALIGKEESKRQGRQLKAKHQKTSTAWKTRVFLAS